MRAGAARLSITPAVPTPMAGYPPIHLFDKGPTYHQGYRPRAGLSLGLHDTLYARALALDSGGGPIFVVVSVDLCLVTREWVHKVRREAERLLGLPPTQLLVVATHTHSGPDSFGHWEDIDPAVEPFLEGQVVTVIQRALERMRPAVLRWGDGVLAGRTLNRPDPTGPVDPQVAVLAVDSDPDRLPIATVVNFACHPIVVGSHNRRYSADFPGYVCRAVEARTSKAAVAMFLNGAAGNINPAGLPYTLGRDVSALAKQARSMKKYRSIRSFSAARKLGQEIAEVAISARSLAHAGSQDVGHAFETELKLPIKADPDLRTYFEHTSLHPAGQDKLRGRVTVDTSVGAIRLGDRALVWLPGEPFVEIGLELKRIALGLGLEAVVAGYANDYRGYLLRESDYLQTRYEQVATPLADASAPLLWNALVSNLSRCIEGSSAGGRPTSRVMTS